MNIDPLLDAVNEILAGIGEAPVSDIEDSGLDAGLALSAIQRCSKKLQQRGWWFNKEVNRKMPLVNLTGHVGAPVSALSVYTGRENLYRHRVAIRKGLVYDLERMTFDLRHLAKEGFVTVSFIVEVPFEDLPPTAQFAVTESAKRTFAQDLEVDANRWRFQREDEDRAMAELFREEMRCNRKNYIESKGGILAILSPTVSKPF